MRIAVNARFLGNNQLDGIGWYSFEVLRRIIYQHPEHQFILLFDRHYEGEFIFRENVIPVNIGPSARHPLLWFIWFEFSVLQALKRYNAELFFSPDGYLPLRTKVPSLIVIHDINFFHRPADLPFMTRWYYNYFFPRFARKADKICTVSEFSRQDIATSYKIPISKIDVHYNGVNTDFRPIDENKKISVRESYSKGKPFFIFIGNVYPRKNLINLCKAFDHFRELSRKEFKLLIVGKNKFLNKEKRRIYRRIKYKDDVIFTGHLKTDVVRDLLASAEALTFVPYFEGFGLPVIEAMMCDIPVIVSGVTSLPEVAGTAALYVDPSDYLSISEAMRMMVYSPAIRTNLIEKGRIQRQQFSWDKTANGLWETLEALGLKYA